jgi:hypothetical protein
MFGLRKTIGSILMVVIFLALASLATFFYNTDQKQKEAITNNALIQKGGAVLGTLVGASEVVADANLQKNVGFGKTMADYIAKINWQKLFQGEKPDYSNDSSTEEVPIEDNAIVLDNTGENADMSLGDRPDLASGEASSQEAGAETENDNKQDSFWARFVALVKKEWADSQNPEANLNEDTKVEETGTEDEQTATETAVNEQSFLSYQKTEAGAEIIFKSKSGQDYKLPLPFKFLSKF